MDQSLKRLLVVPAIIWAIFCGYFTYAVTQQEKRSLYHEYVGEFDLAKWKAAQNLPVDSAIHAQHKIRLQYYSKGLRELYWTFAPFLWISITLSGYIVAVGIFLLILPKNRTVV